MAGLRGKSRVRRTNEHEGTVNPQWILFAHEYCKDFKAKAAAIRAGYEPDAARITAMRLLAYKVVQAEIDEICGAQLEACSSTIEKVLNELMTVAHANPMNYMTIQEDGSAYVDLSDATYRQLSAVSEIETVEYVEGRGENARDMKRVKLKFWNKMQALEMLGKYHKMWVERHELTNPDGSLKIAPAINISFVESK